MNSVAVIGGGAAGMMAALCAAEGGARVTLLEKNEKLGKKVYITGKGRCNLTNNAPRDEFMGQVVRNPRFLYASFSALSNADLMAKMEKLGVPLKVERGERVFPASDHASDVTRALEGELRRLGVGVRFRAPVSSVERTDDGICVDGQRYDRVILATGGASYPSTGSTGDGWRFAEALGHTVSRPLPALVPIETAESWPYALTGLSLKNVTLTLKKGAKTAFSEQGEMLFTHFGVSGPLVLSLSSYLPEDAEGTPFTLDLKPALDEATLDKRLLRDISESPNKRLISLMDGLEPHALGLALLEQLSLSSEMRLNALTQPQRRAIGALIKRVPMTVKRLRGFDEAIITRGGVKTSEINPSTLESKRVPGLYFAGEMIDVDALTGGFNLQIAFSTGALAGRSAAL